MTPLDRSMAIASPSRCPVLSSASMWIPPLHSSATSAGWLLTLLRPQPGRYNGHSPAVSGPLFGTVVHPYDPVCTYGAGFPTGAFCCVFCASSCAPVRGNAASSPICLTRMLCKLLGSPVLYHGCNLLEEQHLKLKR